METETLEKGQTDNPYRRFFTAQRHRPRIEFYVGNAKAVSVLLPIVRGGYELVAYAGPETGVRDRASYVLQQGKIRLVLTTAQCLPIVRFLNIVLQHGDGVKVLALWCR
jgi:4-hydroxyphenylpyruvate dioxygenase